MGLPRVSDQSSALRFKVLQYASITILVIDCTLQEMGTAEPRDISDVKVSTLVNFDGLVVGAPTWNTGADSERSGTGWDDVLNDISGLSYLSPAN